jgi:antitoxin VapB
MIKFMTGIFMPISIKNNETEVLARRLAELTGETLTEAIRAAVAEKYDRLRLSRSGHSLASDLNSIALRCARRPIVTDLSQDEILGYDAAGIPTR